MSTVGDYFASTAIRGIDEGIGKSGVVQSMHGSPNNGSLELMTGTAGPQGESGDAARPFRWEGDIADHAALTALAAKLTTAHAGKAWRVLASDALVYWNGTSFDSFTDAFGASGPDGETCTVSIGTVDTGPVGSELQVTIVGAPPQLTLNLTVPRGVKGRKGEHGGPGPIRNAPDYVDGVHTDRAVPVWDDTIGKWKPRPYPGLRGPWSVVEGQAWDGGAGFAPSQLNISSSTKTIAQLNIPAQDTAWRPIVTGGVVVGTTEAGDQFTTRVDAEVRIGAADGPIVALGAGMVIGADTYNRFQPFYATRGLTPDSTVGVVPAGQAVTLYVVLCRNAGSANYDYSMSRARIVCMARPVGAL
ncbi:hypothetical protein ABZ540_23635 [Nocardia xishanensis]|uniref:hypothetical protein n=1 Tax=Nocardia xishanensis TaxID=238964 RepID=UPI0033F143A4